VPRNGLAYSPLHTLLKDLPVTLHRVEGEILVRDLVEDSRAVKPGMIFLARCGETTDGRDWIESAERAGAACILSDAKGCAQASGPAIECDDPMALGATIADRIHGHPSRSITLIGITGTNGKSTTAVMLHHLLSTPTRPCGLIGGIEIDDGCTRSPASLTTPQSTELARCLAAMVDNDCHAVVMEVSSHALELGRVDQLEFDAAVFTNLSGDHLDFHGDMSSYSRAKRRLFERLPAEAHAIVNIDCVHGLEMASASECTVIECGAGAAARVLCIHEDLHGSRGRFEGPWGSFEASIPLVGRHNLNNALHAVATAFQLGVPIGRIADRLPDCPCPQGRLERVPSAAGLPPVFVDFAHTDEALRSTLSSVRTLLAEDASLSVLFGCGGDRDHSKRARMAAVAVANADHVYVTSDNPRTEDPKAIIHDIIAELSAHELAQVTIEPDRAQAIADAIRHACETNSTLVIAGKGHEQVQLVGDQRLPFRDVTIATRALANEQSIDSWSTPARLKAALPASQWIVAPPAPWAGARGVSIDSRTLQPGNVFIAIRGTDHDGHDHAQAAMTAGASMLLLEEDVGVRNIPCLQVDDTKQALMDLAEGHRGMLMDIPVIAVTGSCGKTTVKDLLKEVLSELGPVCASRRSFNNHIGLPLTLLEASKKHHAIILEMGTSAPGEINRLASISRPDYGIITMIGSGHLEDLDSLDGVAREKYSMLKHVGTAAWIRDDGFTLPEGLGAHVHHFGRGHTLACTEIHTDADMSTFTMEDGATFQLPMTGRHNVINSLPVIALARQLGLDDPAIQRGFDRVTPVAGRGVRETIHGINFIDESYNANPDSMWAAIGTTLESSQDDQRIVLVLGDMLELGDQSESMHAQLGERIAAHPNADQIDLILLMGMHVHSTIRALATSGWPGDRMAHEPDIDDTAIGNIASMLLPGDTVLVKGSRGLSLERVLAHRRATETEDTRV
jgi:murE/murF fusion protein